MKEKYGHFVTLMQCTPFNNYDHFTIISNFSFFVKKNAQYEDFFRLMYHMLNFGQTKSYPEEGITSSNFITYLEKKMLRTKLSFDGIQYAEGRRYYFISHFTCRNF